MEDKHKVVAFDVYGTMLATRYETLPRKGLVQLLERCKEKGLTLCTCSDAEIHDVIADLEKAEIGPNYFDSLFKMPRQPGDFTSQPKDFRRILEHYKIKPGELLVIGDREQRDIQPARDLGCQAIHVSEYVDSKTNTNINELVDLK